MKAIVTCGNRSVGGEDYLPRYAGRCNVEIDSLFLHAHADRFQQRKTAVPFVQVQNAWLDAHGFEGAEASYAEHQLLSDASSCVPAVEARSQLPILRSIGLDIRVEEKQV